MKKYVIEKTFTASSPSNMYPQGYQVSYICKGNHVVLAEAFFDNPALWSEYFYTSKKRAERGMEIMQKNTRENYWGISFRIGEIEVN